MNVSSLQAAALAATVTTYFAMRSLRRRFPALPTSLPLLATPVLVGILWLGLGGSLVVFEQGTRPLVWWLGPATVALAVPLLRQRVLVRQHGLRIVLATALGAITTMATAVLMARWLGLSEVLVRTLSVKSVTSPIALPISARLGGLPELSAAIVVLTGLLGAWMGPAILNRLGVTEPLVRGLALGVSAHGVGTAQAFQEGPVAGAAASLAMMLTGLITAIVVPFWF